MEFLTVSDLANMLKVGKSTISALTTERTRSGDLRENPLPVIRIGRCVRFRKTDIDGWVEKLSARK
jgi:predicted DNA-binding transcriptional regulator AlpA